MNIYWWVVVIFVTSLAVFALAGLYQSGERERVRLARLADPAPLPYELPRAGRFDVGYLPGPPFAGAADPGFEFPDTGPLLLWSESTAAGAALERDVRRLTVEAERVIGRTPEGRWRS